MLIRKLIEKPKRALAKIYLKFKYRNEEYKSLAKAFSVMEIESGDVVLSKNAEESLPIGSVTKLMTILITLSSVDDLEDTVVISEDAANYPIDEYSSVNLKKGDKKVIMDLVEETLIVSACDSAHALGEIQIETNNKEKESILSKLDSYAYRNGLSDTKLVDTTGVSINNVMSANDINFLARDLVLNYPVFVDMLKKTEVQVNGDVFKSTLPIEKGAEIMPFKNRKFIGIKTGFLREAGRSISACMVSPDGKSVHLVSAIGFDRLIERDFFLESLYKELFNERLSLEL